MLREALSTARITILGSSNSSGVPFDAARDIPNLAGKVVLVTGAAGDLGRQVAIDLTRYGRPRRVWLADLPLEADKLDALLETVRKEAGITDSSSTETATELRFLGIDLGSFASVRAAAKTVLDDAESDEQGRLDIAVLNAGILSTKPRVTAEGYEVHFGINYLGHALLARLLMPLLERTAKAGGDPRLVFVSSEGHRMTLKGGIQFERLRTDCAGFSYYARYGQSKLAIIHLVRHLAKQHPLVTTTAIHPGRIVTGMARGLAKDSLLIWLTQPLAPIMCSPVSVGARNHLWAATAKGVVGGKYYEPVGIPDKESKDAKNEALGTKLMEWTDEQLKGQV